MDLLLNWLLFCIVFLALISSRNELLSKLVFISCICILGNQIFSVLNLYYL